MQYSKAFQAFAQKLEHDQAPTLFVQAFHQLYDALQKGERGILPESQIQPAREIPQQSELPTSLCEVGTQALQATVQIRLNGGLGTSMGMKQAKTLLPLKQTSNFLDLIIAQSQALHIPLLLMNSFATQHDTLVQLDKYPQLNASIPQLQATFLQHRAPKVCAQTLQPIESDTHPELTWCPPGHGDLFTALTTSGLLEQLLAHKIQYAFLSNADNLGAFVDTQLLGYFVQQQIPFMMEVTQRTPADRKGGHLAKSKQGQLLLRESAQCPEQDQEDFQNIDKHRYFNTNNLWVHLPTLQQLLQQRDGLLGLPLICNRKTLNPRDPSSPPVFQLETAMGAAIGVIPGAQAICVPRSRFAPVKTTQDLLVVRSDAYLVSPQGTLQLNPESSTPPLVKLDPTFYKMIHDFEQRFPHGPPSLKHCTSLNVKGDVIFGKSVRCIGQVSLHNAASAPQQIPDHTQLPEDNKATPKANPEAL